MMQSKADQRLQQSNPVSQYGNSYSPKEESFTEQSIREPKNKDSFHNADKLIDSDTSSKENEPSQNAQQVESCKPNGGSSSLIGGFCCQVDDVSMPTPKQHRTRKCKKSDQVSVDQQEPTIQGLGDNRKTKLQRKIKHQSHEEQKVPHPKHSHQSPLKRKDIASYNLQYRRKQSHQKDPISFHQQALSCFKLPSFRKAFRWQSAASTTIIESVEEHSPTIEEGKLSSDELDEEEENCYCSENEGSLLQQPTVLFKAHQRNKTMQFDQHTQMKKYSGASSHRKQAPSQVYRRKQSPHQTARITSSPARKPGSQSEADINRIDFEQNLPKIITKDYSIASEQTENSKSRKELQTYDFTEQMKRDNQESDFDVQMVKCKPISRSIIVEPSPNALDLSLDEFDEFAKEIQDTVRYDFQKSHFNNSPGRPISEGSPHSPDAGSVWPSASKTSEEKSLFIPGAELKPEQADGRSEKIEITPELKAYGSRSHHAENISTTTSLSDSPAIETYEICQEQTQTLLIASEAIAQMSDPLAYFGQFGKVEHVQSAQERFMQVRFSDPQSACLSRQSLLDQKIEANFVKKVRIKGIEAKAAQILGSNIGNIFRNSKLENMHSPFDDANIELTFNLLKIRPEEEVRRASQTNSAFFEELSSTSKLKQKPNYNSNTRIAKPPSDMSQDSNTPSLEAAYNLVDQGPYSDPGLPLGFRAAPHFGTMSIQSNPFTVADVTKNSSQGMVPKLDMHQMRLSQASYMQQQQQQMVYSDRSFYEQASRAHDSSGTLSQNSQNAFGQTQQAFPQQVHQMHQSHPQLPFNQAGNSGPGVFQTRFGQSQQQTQTSTKQDYLSQSSLTHQEVGQTNMMQNGQPEMKLSMCQFQEPHIMISSAKHAFRTPNKFALNLETILSGEDTRTTIMIKNIPNKYTQKMLLEKIDKLHAHRYDFFYLPIDLKNNCNVGYAFINFVDPIFILPFYEDLNAKSWERFNSEKICEITYGRIQGKRSLVDNFSYSAETRKVKPLILEVPQYEQAYIESLRESLCLNEYFNGVVY